MFGLFKKSKPKKRLPIVDQIHSALVSIGINDDIESVEKVFLDTKDNIPFGFVTKRELETSSEAELRRNGDDEYKFFVVVEMVGRDGNMSEEGFDLLIQAICYATISRIAESNQRTDYVLKKNQTIGLGTGIDTTHPLHNLIPQ